MVMGYIIMMFLKFTHGTIYNAKSYALHITCSAYVPIWLHQLVFGCRWHQQKTQKKNLFVWSKFISYMNMKHTKIANSQKIKCFFLNVVYFSEDDISHKVLFTHNTKTFWRFLDISLLYVCVLSFLYRTF